MIVLMDRKEICQKLIEQGVMARTFCFMDFTGSNWTDQAPLYNKFVHGVRDVAVSLGIFSLDEAMRLENEATKKFEMLDTFMMERVVLVKLPDEDSISMCSFKCHVMKAILVRCVSLLSGGLAGFAFCNAFL